MTDKTWGDLFKPAINRVKLIIKDTKGALAIINKDSKPEPKLTRHESAYEEFMDNRSEPITPDAVYIPDPSELIEIDEGMVVTDRRRGRPPVFNTPKKAGVLYICKEAATDEYLEALNRKGYEVKDIKEMDR